MRQESTQGSSLVFAADLPSVALRVALITCVRPYYGMAGQRRGCRLCPQTHIAPLPSRPRDPLARASPYLPSLNLRRLPSVNGTLSAGNVKPVGSVGSVMLIRNTLSGGD